MDDDEDMYEEYQRTYITDICYEIMLTLSVAEPGMPFTFEWNDEQEPPMIISHRGQDRKSVV